MACGLLHPIYFLLGVLGPFTFLGHPWPFLILRPHGLLLTPLGFPDPIILSFILGAHGLVINSLLSLFVLLRACYNPFLLYCIIYCPWVCYFSLRALLGPFVSSRPICLFYEPMIHYFCHLSLIVFYPLTNSSLLILLGFFLLLGFPG